MSYLQARTVAWSQRAHETAKPADFLAKAVEELGETARAVISDQNGRPNRGDAPAEAAQVVVVLLGLIGRYYPGRDLLVEVAAEITRLEGSL